MYDVGEVLRHLERRNSHSEFRDPPPSPDFRNSGFVGYHIGVSEEGAYLKPTAPVARRQGCMFNWSQNSVGSFRQRPYLACQIESMLIETGMGYYKKIMVCVDARK